MNANTIETLINTAKNMENRTSAINKGNVRWICFITKNGQKRFKKLTKNLWGDPKAKPVVVSRKVVESVFA